MIQVNSTFKTKLSEVGWVNSNYILLSQCSVYVREREREGIYIDNDHQDPT